MKVRFRKWVLCGKMKCVEAVLFETACMILEASNIIKITIDCVDLMEQLTTGPLHFARVAYS